MKKMLCLVLALLMLFALLAGCTGGNTTQGGGETANTPAPASNSGSSSSGSSGGSGSSGSSGGSSESNEPAPGTETEFRRDYTPIDWPQYPASDVGQDILTYDMVATTKDLPLVAEKTTLTAWWPIGSMEVASGVSNYAEAANMQEIEARTNVHVEFFQPSANELATEFPLMIAAGDYTDMIFDASYYTGGGDKAIADGVYIRLNELIEEYAPNYNIIRNYTDAAKKLTITSEGNIWGFYNICKEHMPGYMGLNMRKDFMDNCGLTERPVTIDDWDRYLTTMKEACGTTWAFAIPPTGVTRHSAFLSAWDVGSDWFQRDGKAMYGPAEPEFRNYVELMKDWYDRGLLRNDFYAVAPENYGTVISEDYGKGDYVAVDGQNYFGSMLARYSDNAFGIAIRQPVLNRGDESHIRFDQGVINGDQMAITTACKNPELAVSWMDYRYTYEGYLLIYYGVEGLTYVRDGDHHISITDNIINNPDGKSPFSELFKYLATTQTCTLCDYTNGWCFLDPAYAEEITVWMQDKCDHNYPANLGLLTSEDGYEFAAIYNDIDTYVQETIPKFIIGQLSMDKYDDFVNQMYRMNLARAIELKQIALDDYNAR